MGNLEGVIWRIGLTVGPVIGHSVEAYYTA